MILDLLYAAGIALGVWLLVVALQPAREDALSVALARLAPQPPQPNPKVETPGATEGEGWAVRAGRPLVPLLVACGLPGKRTAADLTTLEISPQRHLAEKATGTLAGLVLPYVCVLLPALLGAAASWSPWAWMSPVLGAAGFLAPDLTVRARAKETRAEARHALSLFLELTVIALSGGAGVLQSLEQAAASGQGPAFADFRQALTEAAITRTPPWGPLARLGQRLGVGELEELACTAQLAGSEGAKVRASLTAMSASLRVRLLADDEAHASAATERMSLPVVLLLAGFLLFIGFPAAVNAFRGL
ncbi:type II secretion system F family protein [Streptacidiphilus sp. MAP5-3]|uniref:type II secretion system F family protein n=1 Tax=unclassified Streptacidiphilus TaxID=2643834 RepID=UPI0035144910